MRLPQEVLNIGWNDLSPEFAGGESRELELLREIYEGEDLEERETALDTGCQWFDNFAAPAAQWIQSLIPLLSEESDPLVPAVLMHLSLYADTSLPQRAATAEEVEAAMTAIRGGYEKFPKLFHLAPLWVQGLLTTCPDRAPEYLSLLLPLYESESDLAIKAGMVITLAKVSDSIGDWRSRLLQGIREGGDSALAFVCAIEAAVLDGDGAGQEIFDAIIRTSMGDGAVKLFRRCMVRLLPRLSRERQIAVLIGILEEAKDTATCLSIAKFLLEAAYGEIGVVSDLPDLSSDGGSSLIRTQYAWVGSPRNHNLQLPTRDRQEDWLGAIVNKEALQREISSYRPSSDIGPTNLYELFGLPPDHSGLANLWGTR